MQFRKLLILTPVCAALVIVANTPSEVTRHRASLSDDLQAFQASHSTSAVRVIALGREDDLRAVASRHGVHIVRLLENAAVLEATAAQIDTLRNEPGIEHLSGDMSVGHFMTVSNAATLANQVHQGKSGGLLGLGGIAGMTGQGVVIAVLDSGIASHKAL